MIKVSSEVKNRLEIPANSLSMAGRLDWATLRERAGKLDSGILAVLLEMSYFLLVSVGCHTGTAVAECVSQQLR